MEIDVICIHPFLPRGHCPFKESDLLRDECNACDFLAAVTCCKEWSAPKVHPDGNLDIGIKLVYDLIGGTD